MLRILRGRGTKVPFRYPEAASNKQRCCSGATCTELYLQGTIKGLKVQGSQQLWAQMAARLHSSD